MSEYLQTGKASSAKKGASRGARDSEVSGGLKLDTPVKNYNNDATRSGSTSHAIE